ncbi:MAG TPA: glycosyltransferase family 39 protein [Pyrinomonadaceae bacterium]|nr:glycosyltransferase family 39 protein [Pyrinomonadaceae bacterium]
MSHSLSKARIFLLTAVIGLGLAGIVAHFYLGAFSKDTRGVLAVLDRIFDLTLALGLLTILLCAGNLLGEKLKVNFAGTAEEIAFSLFLGMGAVGSAILILGLLGQLRPLPVAALLVVLAGISRRRFSKLYRIILEGLRRATLTREARIVGLLYASFLIFLLLRAATPPNTADEVIYHLPVTKSFVEQGRVYPMFDNALGNLPFLVHMMYALCVMADSDIAARLFSLFLAAGTALALYGFCTRYLTRRVGVVAMFAFFAAGMVVEVAVSTRIDVSLAGVLFLATYAMINYFETERAGWLWMSALLAGFSLGIKHSAGIWLVLIGALYLFEALIRKRQRLTTMLSRGIAYAVIAAAIASPWYIKNYVWFDNPLYPLITGEVAQFSASGLRYFNAEDERKLEAHFQTALAEIPSVVQEQEKKIAEAANARIERNAFLWWDLFLKPNIFLMAEPHQYPNYLFLTIPFLIFLRKPRPVLVLLVLATAFVFAITWTSWIGRYLLPAYPPLTIVAAYVITNLSERYHLLRKLPLFLLAVALGVIVSAGVLSMRYFNSLGFVTGRVSRRDVEFALTYYKPIDFINRNLPPNARVMLMGAQLSYGIERPYTSDESWFSTKWRRLLVSNDSVEQVHKDLKRQGFTHILYSPGIFTFVATMGTKGTGGWDLIATDGVEHQLLRNWSTFTLYQQKYLETVYADKNQYYVFRLK